MLQANARSIARGEIERVNIQKTDRSLKVSYRFIYITVQQPVLLHNGKNFLKNIYFALEPNGYSDHIQTYAGSIKLQGESSRGWRGAPSRVQYSLSGLFFLNEIG